MHAIVDVEALHEILGAMHKEISIQCEKKCMQAQRRHNLKSNVMPVNLRIGDFFMEWSCKNTSHKLSGEWQKPTCVVTVNQS